MKRKEELYLIPGGKQIQDKMVKCYECSGMGFEYKSEPHYIGFGTVNFLYSPVTCKFCQGWGQVPLYAQEQLSTLA